MDWKNFMQLSTQLLINVVFYLQVNSGGERKKAEAQFPEMM